MKVNSFHLFLSTCQLYIQIIQEFIISEVTATKQSLVCISIYPIQMAPTKVVNSITLNMQAIHITETNYIRRHVAIHQDHLFMSSTNFFCECCHAITLVYLFSNFTLKFYLRNSAAARSYHLVSYPSCVFTTTPCLFQNINNQGGIHVLSSFIKKVI